jgi:tRNA(His) 5'-end guanylyltransferase
VRIDGRAFHTFTRDFLKPFDRELINMMVLSAMHVFGEMQGCKIAYVQSDEASFVLTDYDTFDTQPWFGYVKSKVESVAASCMTAAFARCQHLAGGRYADSLATFDARAFNIPRNEVVNYFVWRAKDWARNSLSMYCQSIFSHRELQGRNSKAMHEMLFAKGRNWTRDLCNAEKNGTFLIAPKEAVAANSDIEPRYGDIDAVWEAVRPKEAVTTAIEIVSE